MKNWLPKILNTAIFTPSGKRLEMRRSDGLELLNRRMHSSVFQNKNKLIIQLLIYTNPVTPHVLSNVHPSAGGRRSAIGIFPSKR